MYILKCLKVVLTLCIYICKRRSLNLFSEPEANMYDPPTATFIPVKITVPHLY